MIELTGTVAVEASQLTQPLMLRASELGLTHVARASYPATGVDLTGCVASDVSGDDVEAYWEIEGCLLRISVSHGSAHVACYAGAPDAASDGLEAASTICPRRETETTLIPATFWSLGERGPQAIRREIDRAEWADVATNYPSTPGLDHLMSNRFRPGVGGQLLLWHGAPGTGKTTALRALAHEWREWCELHYVADPESFFGDRASYMMHVLTGVDSWNVKRPRLGWRVIVLEDCGEMLAVDARREVGQALSRLLNACDGLIGRGLRFLVLVTTNEPVSKLHPAVARPGRCAANIEFGLFTADQATSWLAAHGRPNTVSGACHLADLYASIEGLAEPRPLTPIGFAA